MRIKKLLPVFLLLNFFTFFYLGADIKANVFELPNGLKIILAPMETVDATCLTLYHIAGVRDDPTEIKGASSLYQLLMLSATRNLESFDRMMFIKKFGGNANNSVDYDYSVFSQTIPASEIKNALWLESERISSLKLVDSTINGLKRNLYRKMSDLLSVNSHARASSWVKSILFANTAYQTPLYGNLKSIRNFNNQKIKRLYNNFKKLSNIIMVISGKFDIQVVRESIDKRFVRLAYNKKPTKRRYVPVEPRKEALQKNWMISGLPNPFFIYGIRAPGKMSVNHLYFEFIRYYLLDKRISRLERIFSHNGINVKVVSELTDYFESNALLIKVIAKKRIDLEKARIFLKRELGAFSSTTRALSNADIKTTKNLMEIDLKKSMRDLEKRNLLLAENYHLYGKLHLTDAKILRIQKIKPLDIIRIGKRFLADENIVLLNVYPEDTGKNESQ